jgi:O-antigen ligase
MAVSFRMSRKAAIRIGTKNKAHATDKRAVFITLAFLLVLGFCGGSSRGDSLAQIPARLAAIFCGVALLWLPVSHHNLSVFRRPLIFLSAIVALFALQLVPLPPSLWSSINGRAIYDAAQQFAGQPLPWRPINITPDLGINALLSLLPVGAALVATRRLATNDQLWLLRALVMLGLAGAMLGFFQMAQGADSPLRFFQIASLNSPVGFFANRNHHALWLDCTIVMTWAWVLIEIANRPRARAPAVLAMTASLILIFAIVTTGSRAGIILLPLIGAGVYLMIRKSGLTVIVMSRRARAGTISAIVFVFLAILTLVSFSSQAQSLRRLYAEDLAADARSQTLSTVLRMVPDYAPFGSGFGSFERVYRHVETVANLDFTYFNHAHNDLLELLIEGGMPAAILLGIFLWWWLGTSWKIWADKSSSGVMIILGRTSSIVSLAMMAASLPDYPIRTPFIAVVFTISVGWMLIARAGINSDRRQVLPV